MIFVVQYKGISGCTVDMASQEVPLCHVCDLHPGTAGGLRCTHRFCPECFERYVHGSVLELDTSLRCCVCGKINDLIEETADGKPSVTFGRKSDTKLKLPVGIAQYGNGDYVIVDKKSKRVNIFDNSGRLRDDFAYVYHTEPSGGVVVTPSGDMAIPCRDATYDFVSYYTRQGAFVGSAYIRAMENRPCIRGIACDHARNLLYATDENNACIHVINNKTRVQCNRIQLEPVQFEVTPRLGGLAVSADGDLVITDIANHCVKIYSRDGTFRKKIGCYGERPLQFKSPTGVAVVDNGDIIVADRGNQRVQYLDADGGFLRYVVCFRAGYEIYMAPDDVTVSDDGDIGVLMTSLTQAEVGGVRIYR